MSFSFGGSKQKQKQQQSSQVDPWAPTQPLLKQIIGDLGDLRGKYDPTGSNAALDRMRTAAEAGNPAVAAAGTVGSDLVNTPDRTGQIDSAYADLQRRLSPTADGTNADVANNPYLQKLVTQVGDSAAQRVNAQFAGAGRDLSGANQHAVGEGVTAAQLPLLFDQYNRETGRSDAAARDLYGAGQSGSVAQSGMDASRANIRRQGIETLDAGHSGAIQDAKTLFDIEQMRQQLPYQNLGWLTQLLYPAAGLGSQSQGQSTGTKTSVGGQAGFRLV